MNLFFVFFFRANIDEVETEVVEIEAKLDKVKKVLFLLNQFIIGGNY